MKDGRPEPIEKGLEITFADGTRKTRVWREKDGGFLWEFDRDGTRTPLWLSQEAMNVMLELHHQMTWCVDSTTDQQSVGG